MKYEQNNSKITNNKLTNCERNILQTLLHLDTTNVFL